MNNFKYFQQFDLYNTATVSPNTYPVLHNYVACGSTGYVLNQLRNGAKVNERVEKLFFATALHIAADSDNAEQVIIVEMLIKFGANVNAADGKGNTALHIALQRNADVSDHVVRILTNSGCNVNTCNVYNCTPIDYACESDVANERLIRKLLSGLECDTIDDDGNTILMRLLCKRNYKAADVLIKHKRFTCVKKRYDNNTLLHLAVPDAHFETIDSILKLGIDIDAINDKGEQALHIACAKCVNGDIYSIQYLLDCYLDFTSVNEIVTNYRSLFGWAMTYVIWKNSAKLYALNQSLVHNSIATMLNISDNGNYREQVQAVFVEQVEKLKKTVIGETSVTLYDFLTKDDNEVVKLLENESAAQYLAKYYGVYAPVLPMTYNYLYPRKHHFNHGLNGCEVPYYHGNIYCRFQQGLIRQSTIDKCKKLTVHCSLNRLPLLCLDVILFQLANSDLYAFIEAFEQCA